MNFAFAKTVGRSRRNGPDKHGEEHGLILRVMPSGSKQCIWRGTVHGHRRDLGLGAFPHVSLAEARAKALDYRRLARAGSDPATARPTPEPSTKHSKSRAPTFRKTASGPSTHWPQSRMPTSSDSRSSCARGRFICRHDRELRDAARARRNQRPALGDGSINRSASRKLDLPPTRLNGSTSSIPGPFRRARNTRILPKVLSVWVHRIEYEQGGWVASLATHAPLCGVRCGERSDNPSFPRVLRRVSLRERVLPGTGVAGRLTRPSGGDGQYPV